MTTNNDEIQKCLERVSAAIGDLGIQPALTLVSFVLEKEDFDEVAAEYPSARSGDNALTFTMSTRLKVTFVRL